MWSYDRDGIYSGNNPDDITEGRSVPVPPLIVEGGAAWRWNGAAWEQCAAAISISVIED